MTSSHRTSHTLLVSSPRDDDCGGNRGCLCAFSTPRSKRRVHLSSARVDAGSHDVTMSSHRFHFFSRHAPAPSPTAASSSSPSPAGALISCSSTSAAVLLSTAVGSAVVVAQQEKSSRPAAGAGVVLNSLACNQGAISLNHPTINAAFTRLFHFSAPMTSLMNHTCISLSYVTKP